VHINREGEVKKLEEKRVLLEYADQINPESAADYIKVGGYKGLEKARAMQKKDLIDEVKKSGLRGRGGAGFNAGMKWSFVPQDAPVKYVVCNLDEGEPGTYKDRIICEKNAQALLEGMAICGAAIGSDQGYIYCRGEYPFVVELLKNAVKSAKDAGALGDFDIEVRMGAGAYVCGEETALMNSVEGKRGMPRPRPPFPTTNGLFGKPTVINNVETFSNVPSIIHHGAEWFASTGTQNSKGTKVFALSGKIKLTGLVEIPMGTTIRQILFDIAGGIKNNKKFKAVQIGGPSGGCITEQNLDIQIDYESLIKVGAMMGSGGLVVMDEDNCMVDVAKFFMSFIQKESCGKCIPCREGTKRLLEILESITTKPKADDKTEALDRFKGVMQIEKLCNVIKDTSLCGLGQTAPNPVLSTLKWFRDEYEAHVFDRHCPAGVCQNLKVYKIDVDKCTGCTVCAKKCPVGAIIGTRKSPHFINEDKCIGCGACFEACNFEAIRVV